MFKDLKLFWKNDLLAALNVALVALPLGLGIASAGGIPPISGVFSAIVGGVICSFIRGSHVAINGPGNGMIAVVISAMLVLNPYGNLAFNYLLAAFVISGGFMVLFGLLKLGRFGENFPSTVVMGLLAGIGIIIMLKQLKPGLGTTLDPNITLEYLQSIHIPELIIFGVSIVILVCYEFAKNRWIKFIPGPVWVLLFAIPFVLIYHLKEVDYIQISGFTFNTGATFFVEVPGIFNGITSISGLFNRFPFPDFSIINTLDFWIVVLSITLVGTLESLLSAKAIERLDPLERKVDLNKDIMAIGLGTVFSGLVGGMPVNTVIARSSININSGAKSSWSNFYQSIFLLAILIYFTEYINYIPFAALAAILIVTGFKLTKPKIYRDSWLRGYEQIVILLITLSITYFFGLIYGVVIGMIINLLIHISLFEGEFSHFFKLLFNPSLIVVDSTDDKTFVRLYGVLNFLNIQPLRKSLKNISPSIHLTIDFSHLKLVDLTVLEFIRDFAKGYRANKGTLESVGLDAHFTTSTYPHALHYLKSDKKQLSKVVRKTIRQDRLFALAEKMEWRFETPIVWDTPELNRFRYFKQHPIEYCSNVIYGNFEDLNITWEISDMTFREGGFIEVKELHTTEHLVKLPVEIPSFILDKEFLFDRFFDLIEQDDIDFESHPEFSRRFVLKSPENDKVKLLFNQEVLDYFESREVYHIECIGRQILIFQNRRLASVEEIKDMIIYTQGLCTVIMDSYYKNGLDKV